MSTDLPRLYTQTRSGRKSRIPSCLYGTVFFCQEYPDGIYIDKRGNPVTDREFVVPSDIVCDLIPKELLHTLPPHERREQINLREDIKCRISHETYIKKDVDYDPSSLSTDDDSDDYDDESTEIDTGCEEDDSDGGEEEDESDGGEEEDESDGGEEEDESGGGKDEDDSGGGKEEDESGEVGREEASHGRKRTKLTHIYIEN